MEANSGGLQKLHRDEKPHRPTNCNLICVKGSALESARGGKAMQSKLIAAATAVCAMTLAASADAQRGPGWFQGWRVIGYKVVNGGSDTDNIYTPGPARFRQIRVCAFN